MPRDYYFVLGINRTADLNRIKKAYGTVAKKHHPDVNYAPESVKRFREVLEAAHFLQTLQPSLDRSVQDHMKLGGPPKAFSAKEEVDFRQKGFRLVLIEQDIKGRQVDSRL